MKKIAILSAIAVCLSFGACGFVDQAPSALASTYGVGAEQGASKGIIVIGSKGAERAIIIVGGRVSKIEGNTVILSDKSGKSMTLTVKSIDFGPSGSRLKVGDMVNVKDGLLQRAN